MKIAFTQYNPVWENKDENKEKILNMLSGVEQVDLIIFPEMSTWLPGLVYR